MTDNYTHIQQQLQQGSHGQSQALSSPQTIPSNPSWQGYSTSSTAAFGAPRQTPAQQPAQDTSTFSPPPAQHTPSHLQTTPTMAFQPHYTTEGLLPPPQQQHPQHNHMVRGVAEHPPQMYPYAVGPPHQASMNDQGTQGMQFVQLPPGFTIMMPMQPSSGGTGQHQGFAALQPAYFQGGASHHHHHQHHQQLAFAPTAAGNQGGPVFLQPVNSVFAAPPAAGMYGNHQAHHNPPMTVEQQHQFHQHQPIQGIDSNDGAEDDDDGDSSRQAGATGFRQLIVNFLDPLVSNAELHSFFSQIGAIDSARIIVDKDTGKSKGFGFVYYKSSADAGRAVAALNGQHIQGRPIKVSYANHRKRRN